MTAIPTQNSSASRSAGRINLLASDLVNQIAAGEVVERPASAVKELVENAIDAGARSIDVILENGGKKLIEVCDDGCGMSHRDALLSIERHATSKIAVFDDLLAVRTLGFRGEALPSIASVSRFSLLTWDGEEECAIEITREPSSEPQWRPASRPRGTTIRVADLFENVPARRKFLKSSDAEFRSIVGIVSSYALPLYDRSFRLTHNGRVVLDFPAARDPRDRVVQVIGNEAEPALEPIDFAIDGVQAAGFVTRGLRYGSRRNQYFFVNNRLVKDRVLTHAVTRAAESFDFDGHPAVVLFVSVPPEWVDVNVHPAKTEVRFRDSGTVHVVVEKGVRAALGGPEGGAGLLSVVAEEPSPIGGEQPDLPPAQQTIASGLSVLPAVQHQQIHYGATPLFRQGAVVQPPRIEPSPGLGDLRGRVIGQYRDSYILVDMPEGLRLVDQHVAHERVLYDRFNSGALTTSAQRLLSPLVHETSPADGAVLDSHLEELRLIGFEIERFSRDSFAVSAIPSVLAREELGRFFRKLIDASLEEKDSPMTRVRDRVIASLACQAAIKVHRPMRGEEMSRVVADLLESSNPYACPHGRPIIVDIKHLDIERHFHRK
jgi:DNA mismatch repair protein MutL